MSTLDLVVLPGIIRALENAARATAAGHHDAALDDARRALELLGREVVRVTHGGSVGVGVTRVADQLVAARERLGFWLASAPGRSWDDGADDDETDWEVMLYDDSSARGDGADLVARGEGTDLASAILAALEAANSDDRTRKSDG